MTLPYTCHNCRTIVAVHLHGLALACACWVEWSVPEYANVFRLPPCWRTSQREMEVQL